MEQKNERTDNGVGKEEQNKELIEAAKADDLKLVQELLGAGADANYQHEATVGWDSVVDCPLHHAVAHGNLKMARALMEKGAKADRKFGSSGWSRGIQQVVFDQICQHKNPGFLGLALEFGANPNTESRHSRSSMRTDRSIKKTSLHTMIESGELEKVRLLLGAKADPNAQLHEQVHNERGFNQNKRMPALCLALGFSNAASLSDKRAERMVSLLLRNGADPNSMCTRTLHEDNPNWCAEMPDEPRSEKYVPSIVCVDVTCSALHLAIEQHDLESTFLLLFHGANQNIDATLSRNGKQEIKKTSGFFKPDAVVPELRALLASPPTKPEVERLLSSSFTTQDLVSLISNFLG